mgnify:CR=1 FL=1
MFGYYYGSLRSESESILIPIVKNPKTVGSGIPSWWPTTKYLSVCCWFGSTQPGIAQSLGLGSGRSFFYLRVFGHSEYLLLAHHTIQRKCMKIARIDSDEREYLFLRCWVNVITLLLPFFIFQSVDSVIAYYFLYYLRWNMRTPTGGC